MIPVMHMLPQATASIPPLVHRLPFIQVRWRLVASANLLLYQPGIDAVAWGNICITVLSVAMYINNCATFLY